MFWKKSYSQYVALVVLAIAIAFFVNKTVWYLLPKKTLYYNPLEMPKTIAYISLGNKFCPKKEQKPKPVPKADEELILENVVLKGVFIEGEGGFIIIEEQKMTYFVSLNEEYKGYKLIKITPNSAIFEKSSKTYILYLEKEKKEQLRQEKSSLKTSFKQNLFTIKRSKLSEYKRNISSLLRDISFSKIRYNGKDAYKITYLKKNSVFYKNGLKVGDVIVGVNGGDLTNQRRLANLYNNMASLNSLVLDIVRNNEKKELYYEVD